MPYKREDLEDAYLRVRRLTNVRGSVSGLELSPAGDRVYFNGYLGATRSLLAQSRDASEPTRLANAVSLQSISLTGDAMAVVDNGSPRGAGGSDGAPASSGGRAAVVRLPAGELEYYDPNDRLQIDLQQQAEQKFLEASRIMGRIFYDPKMNGIDWQANTAAYLPLARAAWTPDEFDYVANRFIGELNASHLGINSPDPVSPLAQRVGRLGVSTQRVQSPKNETQFEVTDVLPESPATRGAMAIKVGDRITAIDFKPFSDHQTIDECLIGTVGKEVVVSLIRDGKTLDLLVTPTSSESLSTLAYNRWRTETAQKVDQLSNGRLGYIHIQAMNQASLETYKRDLFAACDGKDGLVIDVRWNGGGSTADLLLASIMSSYHAYTVPRGEAVNTNSYPTDRLFIPRFIGPIDMLCNERSFSNAEITAHAFKTLKRGTLVGNTTAGGVISTGQATLLDGTTLRLPGRGWFTPDGKNMELNGARPDILLVQTPEDEVTNDDRQLKAAVDDLMKRLK
ncbi:MAG: S41 family peptidase [Tepidisphaeraceae bacterium]